MNKALLGALSALALAATGTAPALAAQSAPTASGPQTRASAATFAGTVALSNCSGSVVKLPRSKSTDPALVLSNGHCLEGGMPEPGEVVVGKPSSRTFTLLNAHAEGVGTLKASRMVYATMTGTDISVYRLTRTYGQIEDQYGIKALPLSDKHPVADRDITVVSGYWKKKYGCQVDGFARELREGGWTFKDSVRYTAPCHIIGGTSGSPVVDNDTGQVVAVNNTLNESGEKCTLNNPCEVDKNGKVTIHQGIGYAQETYRIPGCFGSGSKLYLKASGCRLPRPTA